MIITERITVGILLASYNGEKFIAAQLDSLIAQTYKNWKLFIRDDGSADDTISIIEKYEAVDQRILLLHDNKKNLGSCQNFATLLNITKNRFAYIMFCDQDDFWLPFKIEATLTKMQQFEEQEKKEVAVLVYTNFQYVDINLKVIASKKNFQSTKVSNLSLAHVLAQNPAYGCTMMLNKKLADLIEDIPIEAENHDYWVALVACALGKILYIGKQSVLYRQHNNNISTNYNSNSIVNRFRRIVLQKKSFEDVRAKIFMAMAFKAYYLKKLNQGDKKILNDFISLGIGNSISILLKNIKNGVRRQTLSQTFLFYISIALIKMRNA